MGEVSQHPLSVLLVEDEEDLRALLAGSLRRVGHRVRAAADGLEAESLLDEQVFDVMITDIHLPGVDGLTLLRRVRATRPDTDAILLTGFGSVADAVAALKEGARDYLVKPLDPVELGLQLERIAEERALKRELAAARAQLGARTDGPVLIGSSPEIVAVRESIEMMALSDAPVCITGESGTGKELVARLLHAQSSRRRRPFVAVNCAALPETLLEAELFGHVRGAFTGAVRNREGRFKAANGGTLLLDEVAEMPLSAQAKLLRALEEHAIQPLGTNESVRVDVRVVSATHRDLRERISAGLFRDDLYYRLNVLRLHLPPLRERRADLPLLVEHQLRKLTPPGKEPPRIAPAAWAALTQYHFDGNVRELAHALEHAVVLSGGREIDLRHLPAEISRVRASSSRPPAPPARTLASAVHEFEREYIVHALQHTHGNRTRAADLLGITRKSLWEKLKRHRIDPSDSSE